MPVPVASGMDPFFLRAKLASLAYDMVRNNLSPVG